MVNFDPDEYQIIPAYTIYSAYIKAGVDSGYARAFAKGLIYENAGLTPTYLYDEDASCIYVLPQEFLEKTVTIQ